MRPMPEVQRRLSAADLSYDELVTLRSEIADACAARTSRALLRVRALAELRLRDFGMPVSLAVAWEYLDEAERMGDRTPWHALIAGRLALADGAVDRAAELARLAAGRGHAGPGPGWLLFAAVRAAGGDLAAALAELGGGLAPEPYAGLARLEAARLAQDAGAVRRELEPLLAGLPPVEGVAAPSLEVAAGLVEGEHYRWAHQEWTDPASFEREPVRTLAEKIEAAVRERRPYALVRVGDGESAFVGGRAQRIGGATVNGAGGPLPGRVDAGGHLSAGEHRRLADRLLAALGEADSLGLPDVGMFVTGPRGMWTVQPAIHEALLAAGTMPAVSHSHVHYQLELSGAIADFLAAAPAVGLIGPESPVALGLPAADAVVWHAVPGEYHYRGRADSLRHYPERFEELLEQLEVPVPGMLYLVGAGILGKIYCAEIKARGGIAIDVGGLMDLWSGLAARGYAFRLPRRDGVR